MTGLERPFALTLLLAFVLLAPHGLWADENSEALAEMPASQRGSATPAVAVDTPCGFQIGDLVYTLVAEIQGSNLPIYSGGKIVCFDTTDATKVMVSFDNWTDGHNNFQYCIDQPADPGPDNSHWFVKCTDLAKGTIADRLCGLAPGDIVRSTRPNPEGATDLPAGSWGKVICANYSDPTGPSLLVSWNAWPNGIQDTAMCDSTSVPIDPAASAWWVRCAQVVKAPDTCGLNVGDRVRLSIGINGLPAGSLGTVVCDGINLASFTEYQVLVSWDGWAEGHDQTSMCTTPPVFPGTSLSHYWMRCNEVELYEPYACGFRPGDRIEAAVANPQGRDLELGHQGRILCIIDDPELSPKILVTWDNWTGGHDILSHCNNPANPTPGPPKSHYYVDCSDIRAIPACGFHPGDRVLSTVNNPSYSQDLPAGTAGTVICVDNQDSMYKLLVSWDNYTLGTDGSALGSCDSGYELGPSGSHRWVRCNEVKSANNDCCGFQVGNRVVLEIPDPSQAEFLPRGTEGTVICCYPGDPALNILVSWDNWSNGWATNANACPLASPPLNGTADDPSLWYVSCNALRPAPYDGWLKGDFNHSHCTDIGDFLFLLDHWQSHTFIGDFLDLLDNWQQGPWCN